MKASELVQLAYQEALAESTAPAASEENYKLLFNAANEYIDVWQDEPGVEWESLLDWGTISSITAAQEFTPSAVEYDIRKLSTKDKGGVYITKSTGEKVHYAIVKPSQLGRGGFLVAWTNGKLRFAEPITEDSDLIGGTINFPFIKNAPHLVDANSLVPVDRPMWLVYMCALYFASQDYIKSSQAPRLAALAKQEMKSMKYENISEADGFIDHGNKAPLSRTFN